MIILICLLGHLNYFIFYLSFSYLGFVQVLSSSRSVHLIIEVVYCVCIEVEQSLQSDYKIYY